MSDTDTPAWAFKVAYERSHGKHRFTADHLKKSYTEGESAEAAVMRAFAAHIATREPELAPVDPDEELVKGLIVAWGKPLNSWNVPTFFDDPIRQEGLQRALSYYKEHKA